MTALGVKPATRHPRVVGFMAERASFVCRCWLKKAFAYEVRDVATWKNLTIMRVCKTWKILSTGASESRTDKQ